jgi:hypothetical protein
VSRQNDRKLPADVDAVAQRLSQERPELGAVELDRVKLRAMSRAKRRASTTGSRKAFRLASGWAVSVMLAVGVLAGGGAVIAATGGAPFHASSGGAKSAANNQYCPPSSQQPGKPKPGSCGKPKTKAAIQGPKKCVTTSAKVKVNGKQIAKIVYRFDGKKIKTVKNRDKSSVKVNLKRLASGKHRVTAKVTFKKGSGAKPKTLKKVVRRCA